jgi:hypothetical protein
MKRVVTGVNENGRSYVVSSDEVTVDGEVWNYKPEDVRDLIAGVPDGVAVTRLESPPGGIKCIYARLPPDAETPPREPSQGKDEDGFHTTRTVDVDFIVDGELTLVLEEDTVHLQAGDFVIQQVTRHAWRNESDKPATLFAVLHTPA